MNKKNLIIVFLLLACFTSCSLHHKANKSDSTINTGKSTENWNEVKDEVLLKTTKSWDGKQIRYPGGQPEITILRIVIPEGMSVSKHCHPVPSFGYMIQGALEVQLTGSKKRNLIREGDTIPEVANVWHSGRAVEDTEIIVFYTGNTEFPLTLKPDSSSQLVKNCK